MTDPQPLRDAVDLLVREHGLDGALAELRRRHREVSVVDSEHDRVCAALGVVKRRRADE